MSPPAAHPTHDPPRPQPTTGRHWRLQERHGASEACVLLLAGAAVFRLPVAVARSNAGVPPLKNGGLTNTNYVLKALALLGGRPRQQSEAPIYGGRIQSNARGRLLVAARARLLSWTFLIMDIVASRTAAAGGPSVRAGQGRNFGGARAAVEGLNVRSIDKPEGPHPPPRTHTHTHIHHAHTPQGRRRRAGTQARRASSRSRGRSPGAWGQVRASVVVEDGLGLAGSSRGWYGRPCVRALRACVGGRGGLYPPSVYIRVPCPHAHMRRVRGRAPACLPACLLW